MAVVEDAFADLHVVEESAVRAPPSVITHCGPRRSMVACLRETEVSVRRISAVRSRPISVRWASDLDRVALRGAETEGHHCILRILA
jgi:hypothetical protein